MQIREWIVKKMDIRVRIENSHIQTHQISNNSELERRNSTEFLGSLIDKFLRFVISMLIKECHWNPIRLKELVKRKIERILDKTRHPEQPQRSFYSLEDDWIDRNQE